MSNLIKIENTNWKLNVDLNGGRIVELKYKNKVILGTFDRIDGKLGNTHVCVPNFAEDGANDGYVFHGPFRNLEWIKASVENVKEKIVIFCENKDIIVEQRFEIGEKFSHSVLVKNISKENKPLNLALHNYFGVLDSWLGIKINGKNEEDGFIDSNYIEANKENIIEFADGRKVKLELSGLNYLKLWTGFIDEDNNRIFDANYICIEPVQGKIGEYFGTEKSILKPGESREVSQIFSL